MASTSSRRRLAPGDRREELIEAALQVLREKGLDTRVEDVVQRAHAAKGTFYLYFRSWDELLREVRARLFAAFDERFPPPADDVDWLARADELAVGFVDFTLELGGLHEAIFHGPIACTERTDERVDAVTQIAEMLRFGCTAGHLAVEDVDVTARLLFAVMHETVTAITEGTDRRRAVNAMRALLGRALAAPVRAKERADGKELADA